MKRYLGNFIDVLCLSSCGIFACIVTHTVPDRILDIMTQPMWIALGVAVLLLLAVPRLTKMLWNVLFCLSSLILLAELAAWASQGFLVPPPVKGMVEPYTIPALWENGAYYEMGSFALLWAMGALCCLGFWRVTWTAVGCFIVWLGMSFAFHFGGEAWLAMENAPLAKCQSLLVRYPWVSAFVPGLFVVLYAALMSMYDGLCTPWRGTRSGADLDPTPKPAPKPAVASKPVATPKTAPAAAAPAAAKPALKPVPAPGLKTTAPVVAAPALKPVKPVAPAEVKPAPAPEAKPEAKDK